jgi:predicted RNase H-like HicB family nuclease
MKRKFSATISLEGEWFIAQCLEIDIASQGQTEQEALTNLSEALELHLEAPTATVLPHVRTIEIDISAA